MEPMVSKGKSLHFTVAMEKSRLSKLVMYLVAKT